MSTYGLGLFPQHARLLAASAIAPDVARARGYVSVDTKTRLEGLGFASYQQLVPGLLVPLWDASGGDVPAGYQYRPDHPRERDGRSIKYESVPGSRPILDVPPMGRRWLRQRCTVWITEGSRKADALVSAGLAAVSLAGVSAWLADGVALGDWRDLLLRGRDVVIAFDSDVMTKPSVRGQLDALSNYLAARGAAVRRCYLPQVGTGKVGVDDYLGAGHSVHELEQLVVTEAASRPIPLRASRAARPFPVDALPASIADMVAAVAEFTQTPPDLAGTVALGVLSACAGGHAVAEVRPGWREPVNLFTVVAMPPGSRKSPVFATMTAPLLDVEHDLVDRLRSAIVEAEATKRIAEKAAEAAKHAAAKADGDQRDQLTADAIAAAHLAEAIDVPAVPRIFADNVTPEAAATLLAEQGGRLAILSPEGGIFDVLAGRYSNGIPDLDLWLKGHAGDQLRVDRKGRPAEFVPHPSLTVVLTVQPTVLHAIGRNAVFAGRGLLARFLYALPPNNVGRRRIGTASVPAETVEAYATTIRGLAETMAGWTDPAVLPLTAEAGRLVLQVEAAVEPRLAPGSGDLAVMADWGAKLAGATVRIAALLHLASDPAGGWASSIDERDVQRAIRLAGYFTEHAQTVYQLMGADASLEHAEHVLAYLRKRGWETFTVRDLFRVLSRNQFPKVGDLLDVLELLEAHGWVTRLPAPPREGSGRAPSPAYAVHPEVLSAESAEPTEPPTAAGSGSSGSSADSTAPPEDTSS
jgi:hypothetical protein